MDAHGNAALALHVTHDEGAVLSAQRRMRVRILPIEDVQVERTVASGDGGTRLMLEPEITLV